TRASFVRVYVNGFQQLPAVLQLPAAGSRERRFRADLLLNQDANRVEVALPGLVQDSSERVQSQAVIPCRPPDKTQRRHLLVISYHGNEGRRIQDQFKHALGARSGGQGQLSTPAYESLIPYGPLTGDLIDPAYVLGELFNMRDRIEGLTRNGAVGNDVVVFF